MATIDTFLSVLKTQGIFSFFLPFLLVFSIIFGILQKMKIFGEGSTRINVIIALVFTLYVVGVSPWSDFITSFFANFFTQTSILLVTLLVGLMIFTLFTGILGHNVFDQIGKKYQGLVLFGTIVLAVWLFSNSGGFTFFSGSGGGPDLGLSQETILLIILVVGTVLAIWFIARESGGGGGGGGVSLSPR